MKKILVLLTFLGFAFTNIAFAQTGSFNINLGTTQAEQRSVLLYLTGPANTAYMQISNRSDFSDSIKKPYAQALLWDICSGLSSCDVGTHNVYVKFISGSGAEQVVSNSINYVNKPASNTFNRVLRPGSQGSDVRDLQIYLNTHGFLVASIGPGSPGQESTYFGPRTKMALIKFQNANSKDILAPIGLTIGSGILGTKTIGFIISHP